jgi:hypothetical protein
MINGNPLPSRGGMQTCGFTGGTGETILSAPLPFTGGTVLPVSVFLPVSSRPCWHLASFACNHEIPPCP